MTATASCFIHGDFEASLRRCPQCYAERLERTNEKLREALSVYADARHWAITRDDRRHPSAVWIGPGATETIADAPKTAREALQP